MKPVLKPLIVEQLPSQNQTLDNFLTRRDVLRHIGLSNTTLYKMMADGSFPRQIKLKHCTSVVWSAYEVHQWMEQQKNGRGA